MHSHYRFEAYLGTLPAFEQARLLAGDPNTAASRPRLHLVLLLVSACAVVLCVFGFVMAFTCWVAATGA